MARETNSEKVVWRKRVNGEWEQLLPCVYHGSKQPLVTSNFYVSNKGSKWRGFDHIPICSDCINDKIYMEYYNKYKDHKKAIYLTCRKLDIPFYDSLAESAISQMGKNENSSSSFGYYMRNFNVTYTNRGYKVSFDDGEILGSEGVTSKDILKQIEAELIMTEDDKMNRNRIVKAIGYDPFEGMHESDKKFLYNDLSAFMRNDVVNDPTKVGDAIQYVSNNHQIRKLDLYINVLMRSLDSAMDESNIIGRLTKQKRDIATNNDKLANREWMKNSEAAKESKLGYKLTKLRELGFEEAEVNYIDQKTAEAMKKVVDISNASILDQISLNDADVKDMFAKQRRLIEELQSELDKKDEMLVESRREVYMLKTRFGVDE